MTLKIEDARPAVLSGDLAERIDERLQLLQKRLAPTLAVGNRWRAWWRITPGAVSLSPGWGPALLMLNNIFGTTSVPAIACFLQLPERTKRAAAPGSNPECSPHYDSAIVRLSYCLSVPSASSPL